jgi:hypothetical protein
MPAGPSFARFIAIDWSGASSPRAQRQAIVSCVAERVNGLPRVISLAGCRDRQEIVAWLAERVADGTPTVVGLGFPFSYAKPFLDHLEVPDFSALLAYMASLTVEQDFIDVCGQWMKERGHDPRLTHRDVERLPATRGAESPLRALKARNGRYQFVGARQVGKAAITGIAAIAQLKQRAQSVRVWPFEDLGATSFVLAEIWPRLALRGERVVKKDYVSRGKYLTTLERRGINLEPEHRGLALGSDHAIDALAAGIEMASSEEWSLPDRRRLPPEVVREGWILGVDPPDAT